jgi:hypothetical protein
MMHVSDHSVSLLREQIRQAQANQQATVRVNSRLLLALLDAYGDSREERERVERTTRRTKT